MKFLLDESVEYRLLPFLHQQGYDVTAIGYDYPAGLKDHAVLDTATKEDRILITNDRDFGELIFRQRLFHTGVIYFRMKNAPIQRKLARLAEILRLYREQLLLRLYLVVKANSVRVRKREERHAA